MLKSLFHQMLQNHEASGQEFVVSPRLANSEMSTQYTSLHT
jgi:hypothetical protein